MAINLETRCCLAPHSSCTKASSSACRCCDQSSFDSGGAGLATTSAPVNDRIVGLLVACFGIVYALVGRDAARFGPVLWAGIVGKLGIVALLLPDVLAGRAAAGTAVVLAGDALFTFGFLVFLLGRRKTRA